MADATTSPLADALAALDPTDAEVITSFEANVPPTIPELAVAWAAYPTGQYREPAGPGDELVIASVRPTELEIRALCIAEEAQIACADGGGVWRVQLDDPEAAILDVSGADGTRPQGVLLPVGGDERRPQVTSRGFWLAAPPELPAVPGSTYERPAVLGGCGLGVVVDDLTPRDSFTPLTTAAEGTELFLVISTCDDEPSRAVLPLLVVDDAAVVPLVTADDAPRAIAVEPGRTYAIPVPVPSGADRLQAFVLPGVGRDGWVSWPLAVER